MNSDLEAVARGFAGREYDDLIGVTTGNSTRERYAELYAKHFEDEARAVLLDDPVRQEIIWLLEDAVTRGEGLHLWRPEPQNLLARLKAQTEG